MEIPLSSEKNVKLVSTRLICDYIQLLLYQRCQIPEPVQLIRRKLQKKSSKDIGNGDKNWLKKKKETAELKKCEEILQSIDKIAQFVKLAVECNAVEALVLFGSTPFSTKDMFSITIRKSGEYLSQSCETFKVPTLDSFSRRLCFKMVQSGLDMQGKSILTKTHFFIKCEKTAADCGLVPWPNYVSILPPCDIDGAIATYAGKLKLECDKENSVVFYKREKSKTNKDLDKTTTTPNSNATKTAVSSNCSNCDSLKTNCSESKHFSLKSSNIRSKALNLSTEEILEAVLSTDSLDCDSDNSDCDVIDIVPNLKELMWFQIPIAIKGFKYE
nr:uncharacterized protein LOC100178824 isoform X2 [Ciona intestinalis]|eukprot:XP_018670197.1 uncharacterized protein LOC100178824 isoform X2 [Ciona intestinalis]